MNTKELEKKIARLNKKLYKLSQKEAFNNLDSVQKGRIILAHGNLIAFNLHVEARKPSKEMRLKEKLADMFTFSFFGALFGVIYLITI